MAPLYRPYSYATFRQAKFDLASRLYDPSGQFLTDSFFWTNLELGLYIVESLRTFNALANFWRQEFTFNTTPTQTWQDITILAGSTRAQTVLDTDLYGIIECHLLEPVNLSGWSGSKQFSLNNLLQSVQNSRDEVLGITGCQITQRNVAAPLNNRILLPPSIIDVRRVAWIPTPAPLGYSPTVLYQDDDFSLETYEQGWSQSPLGTVPSLFRQSAQPPVSIDLDCPPPVPGNLDILSVESGTALLAGTASGLSVPDDWTWVIKFGSLCTLFSMDSDAGDPLRADYCKKRYEMGLSLLTQAPAILSARIDNLPLSVDSVKNIDDYRSGWQAEYNTRPDSLLAAGLNMVGFAPVPDAGPYGVTLLTLGNMPVPVRDSDFIQLGPDDYRAVLDYAQHLACLKQGGQEFISTFPLLDSFMKQVAKYNSKVSQFGAYMSSMYELSQQEEEDNPRIKPEEV